VGPLVVHNRLLSGELVWTNVVFMAIYGISKYQRRTNYPDDK